MSEWGIPNWRDPKTYGEMSQWGDDRWRWEFIRRRDDYRTDFFRLRDTDHPGKHEFSDIKLPFVPIDTIHTGRKYGYYGLLDPCYAGDGDISGFPPTPMLSDEYVSHWLFGRFYEKIKDKISPNESKESTWLYFNISEPIEPQIEHARSQLLFLQKQIKSKVIRKRKHLKKWPTYIRALDAFEDGASLVQIANDVLPDMYTRTPQAARDVLKQAREVQMSF